MGYVGLPLAVELGKAGFHITGIDKDSQDLCPQMKHFADMTDFEVYSIVKYLRSIPKVPSKIPRSAKLVETGTMTCVPGTPNPGEDIA